MPDLIIDGLHISVPEGTTVIEAAESAGIMIPRLCCHPALKAVGACRMCAVMFVSGVRRPGLDMSCMVKAADGMVVDTNHPEAVAYRRNIAELLMLDHPHDCPICDEGGQCLLQDMIISCGHSNRATKGRKRTYRNQDLGPLVTQEMNRCIHCYRCVRYYQEFAGGRDFGAMRIAGDVVYRRAAPGTLQSIFSGNLVDICPTGVFTDKPSRHKARPWDMERGPSVCLSCSLGCNTTVQARYRSVIRLEPRVNPAVNGHFLCDRGRHGYEYANLPERGRVARRDGVETTVEEALAHAAKRLGDIQKAHGQNAVACLGSSRQSLESQGMLRFAADGLGWTPPEYVTGGHRKKNLLACVAGQGQDVHVSQADVARSDCILVIGAAPLSEAPMLALAIRQAVQNGAHVAVIDPRPVSLPLPFTHIPARRRDMEAVLGAILHRAFPADAIDAVTHPGCAAFLKGLKSRMPDATPPSASPDNLMPEAIPPGQPGANLDNRAPATTASATPGWGIFADALSKSRFPVVICGSDIVGLSTVALAAGAAQFLAAQKGAQGGRAGFFPVLARANAFGAAFMNRDPERSFDDILDSIENGTVRALVCVESDPLSRYANHARIHNALKRLELLICMDYLPTQTAAAAHVFLPSQTVFEAGGSFINQEGRLQTAAPVHACGLPMGETLETDVPVVVTKTAPGDQTPTTSAPHPPRRYSTVVPGSDPRPAWELLARLGQNLGLAVTRDFNPWRAVTAADPALAALSPGASRDQALILPERATGIGLAARPADAVADDVTVDVAPDIAAVAGSATPAAGADLILTETAFGTEELSSYGSILKSLSPEPEIILHALDAQAIEIRDEDYVHMACAEGRVGCFVRTADNMARGTVILPRRADIGWQRATAGGTVVEFSSLSPQKQTPHAPGAKLQTTEQTPHAPETGAATPASLPKTNGSGTEERS